MAYFPTKQSTAGSNLKRLALIVALVFLASILISERSRESVFGGEGYRVSGGKHGVEVGMNRAVARKILIEGRFVLREIDKEFGGLCFNGRYGTVGRSFDELEVWRDEGWARHGTLCVGYIDEKVVRIMWLYGGWWPTL
jgi:hypothetical protein